MDRMRDLYREVREFAIALAHKLWSVRRALTLKRSDLVADSIPSRYDTLGLRVASYILALHLFESLINSMVPVRLDQVSRNHEWPCHLWILNIPIHKAKR